MQIAAALKSARVIVAGGRVLQILESDLRGSIYSGTPNLVDVNAGSPTIMAGLLEKPKPSAGKHKALRLDVLSAFAS